MSNTNHLFDAIFEPTQQSPVLFLIHNNWETTYSEFHKTINQISNLLIQKAMKPGERVAVQAEKSNLQIALYAATLKAGGVYLPLNTGYTLSELEYFIEDSGSKIIVIDKKIEEQLLASGDTSITILTLNSDEYGSVGDVAKK